VGCIAVTELLQSKNSATRFQIMVEIAASGSNIQQRDIASRLNISSQAVSNYIGQLDNDGLVTTTGRSQVKVTNQGVNWMLKMLRQLNDYITLAQKAVTNISMSAAIAEHNIEQGQNVNLVMREGILFATSKGKSGAKGVATSTVNRGEDIGVIKIEGLIKLTKGTINILSVPDIQEGGSKQVDLNRLKAEIGKTKQIGAIGIEALAAIRKIGSDARYFYGVREATTQAAQHGASFTVVCTNSDVPSLLGLLREKDIEYKLTDVRLEISR
jgi:putative transcriptional regulator